MQRFQYSGKQPVLNDTSSESNKLGHLLTQQKILKQISDFLSSVNTINGLLGNSFFKSQLHVIMDTDSLDSLILSNPLLTPQFLVVQAQTLINENICPSRQKDMYKMSSRCLTKTSKISCQDILQLSKKCLKHKSERHLRKTS